MRTMTWSLTGAVLSAGLLLSFSPGISRAGDDSSLATVRVSDGKLNRAPILLTSDTTTGPVLELSGNPVVDYVRTSRFERQLDAQVQCEECQNGDGGPARSSCSRRYGYFIPTGGCGKGVQHTRHYGMDYAVNPEYFDQRDGKLFAAQGYGAPMAVPLAPNVGYTYNHGWGIPSSRLTPISRFAPHPMYLRQP
jgi:hypothetical protein